MTTQMQTREDEALTLKGLLSKETIKKRFEEILGPRRGAQFISSILTTVGSGSKQLQLCTPNSVMTASAKAAAMDLSIDPALGQAAIVPYKNKGIYEATFQIMSKGIIQLALRSSKYKKMVLAEVYEGQLVRYDRFKNEIILDESKKKSDKVEGFYFRFELINGGSHEAYWSIKECVDHGWKYSKAFRLYGSGLWMDDPLMPKKGQGKEQRADIKSFKGFCTKKSGLFAMCAKTVVKNTISQWGPMSTDMQDAFTADQAKIKADGKPEYIDTTAEQGIDEGTIPDPKPATSKDKAPEDTTATVPPTEDSGGHAYKDVIIEKVTDTEIDKEPACFVWTKGGDKFWTKDKAIRNACNNIANAKKPEKIRIFCGDDTDMGIEIERVEKPS